MPPQNIRYQYELGGIIKFARYKNLCAAIANITKQAKKIPIVRAPSMVQNQYPAPAGALHACNRARPLRRMYMHG
jgi:hypothetical protein